MRKTTGGRGAMAKVHYKPRPNDWIACGAGTKMLGGTPNTDDVTCKRCLVVIGRRVERALEASAVRQGCQCGPWLAMHLELRHGEELVRGCRNLQCACTGWSPA